MPRKVPWLGVVMALAVLSSFPSLAQQPAPAPKRVALLVGVSQYERREFISLRWSENDVDELAAELKRLRFDKVVVLKGSSPGALRATATNITVQLKALLKDVGKNDVVLVALSGHGQQVFVRQPDGEEADEDFFCPVEAVNGDASTMLKIATLTDDILRRNGGQNLLLIDASRDNPTEKRKRGIQGRVVSLPQDTAILFSCRAGQVSVERDELKHSVFFFSVVEALRQGKSKWQALVLHVQERVHELTGGEQTVMLVANIGKVDLARP